MAKLKKKNLYKVQSVEVAKEIATTYLKMINLENVITFGLPEINDRYHHWHVPLITGEKEKLGEVVIDAISTLIVESKTTKKEVLESRLLKRKEKKKKKSDKNGSDVPKISNLRNTIGHGDCKQLLSETPAESVDLVFTSPPYYNAKVEYADYITYEEYLLELRKVIHQCHRVLNEGRFFVINIAPVLLRRASRSEASKRIAVPFDLHRIFIEEGYDFIDDIIWVKPEGAGWATGRGRRFAADRNPLQYKAVPVTEYVLVYRKRTDKLIDWHIRKHPNQEIVAESKITGEYDVTNIWKIHPRFHKIHPAVFPYELAEKVIRYFSFKNDVVLDPYAGVGTVGKAAIKLGRRFVLFERDPEYIEAMKDELKVILKSKMKEINYIDCTPYENKEPFMDLD